MTKKNLYKMEQYNNFSVLARDKLYLIRMCSCGRGGTQEQQQQLARQTKIFLIKFFLEKLNLSLCFFLSVVLLSNWQTVCTKTLKLFYVGAYFTCYVNN